MTKVNTEYRERYAEVLQTVAKNLECHLAELLKHEKHIDRVSARAKHPDSFEKKAAKTTKEGKKKYSDPIYQIQDQIGARIIVFYLDDVEPIAELVQRYFAQIEIQDKVPESEWEFGYFGKHFILRVPSDVFLEDEQTRKKVPEFFELQVKTLFQHAYSESSHDLSYKTSLGELQLQQQRHFAFAAAQAWGADDCLSRIYNELKAANDHGTK